MLGIAGGEFGDERPNLARLAAGSPQVSANASGFFGVGNPQLRL